MTFWNALYRRKHQDDSSPSEKSSELSRVFGPKDLILLGVGSTLGVGVYILPGSGAFVAGPAVVISFLIAAIAATLSGLCYAEFGCRVPKSGSAYTYTYVCIGEFVAFTIGWLLILQHLIGPASISRGVSSYLDAIISNSTVTSMEGAFSNVAYLGNTNFWSSYFDFFAFGLPIVVSVLLAFGLRESSVLNMISTSITLLVVLFVIIAGSTFANLQNWIGENKENTYSNFFQMGIINMIKGAAICFFGFVGFDCIATTGEEVRRPQKMIPISILVTLFIVFLVYFGISAVLTLMIDTFSQNEFVPLVHAFNHWSWPGALWIIAIGAIFGLSGSLFGAMIPLPQIINEMSLDGLLFPFLGSVDYQYKAPLVATLISGLLTGVIGAVFDLTQLVEMMSLGTLIAYTIVAACVLLLRYRPYEEIVINNSYVNVKPAVHSSFTFKNAMKQFINVHCHEQPTQLTFYIVVIEIISFSILSLGMGGAVLALNVNLESAQPFAIATVGIIGSFLILLLISMSSQPRVETNLPFQVPLIPLIPALNMFVNLYLMMMLSYETWIRFAVWMIIGFSIYFLYGKNHSRIENETLQQSYNGRVLSTSRTSNQDYNMPATPVHISIQAPTPSPSWASLNSFGIIKDQQNEQNESSNTNKIHSENGVPTLSQYKQEYMDHKENPMKESEDLKKTESNMGIDSENSFPTMSQHKLEHLDHKENPMKESEDLKKTELNMDIDSFVDDAFSYFSSNSLRQEGNNECSQDSISYSPSNAETYHNELINENNLNLPQNESQENKATIEETIVNTTNKNTEFNSELIVKDKVYNEGIKKTDSSNKTLNRENFIEEKNGDSNLFGETRRGETNLDKSQSLHTQSTLDLELSNGEKTSENKENGTASNELNSGINIVVEETSLSGSKLNPDENVHQPLHEQTKLTQDLSNGENTSSNNNKGENNIAHEEIKPTEDITPKKNVDNKIGETVKPLEIDINKNLNIKVQDFLKSKTNANKSLNKPAPKDTCHKNNNIEIISMPKSIKKNKYPAIVTIRSLSPSSTTESTKINSPSKETTFEIRNQQQDILNTNTTTYNEPSILSLSPGKGVPTNASVKTFQQKSYTGGRDSDKRKTIKIIQKTKARAPLPPQLKIEVKSSSGNLNENNDSRLSRTFSIRNSEFSNKLNELLKTKLETGPQPTQNSLKNANSKSVNDLVNLKEMNEQILRSSDYHKLPGNSPINQRERQGTVFRSFNNKDKISGPALQNKEPTLENVNTKDEDLSPPLVNDNSEDTKKEIKKKLENLFTQKIKPIERPSIRPQVQSKDTKQEEFETIKRQRLLMGDVLASIKFLKNKSNNDVQNPLKKESFISSASEDEVFTRDSVSNSIIIQNKQTTVL